MIGDTLLTWLKGKVEIVIIKEIFVNVKKMNYCAIGSKHVFYCKKGNL